MKILRIFGWIISLASIVFVFVKVLQTGVSFEPLFSWSSIPVIVLVLTLHLLSLLLLAQCFYSIIEFFEPMRRKKTGFTHFYAKTYLAKYIPGNVMHLVSRNVSAAQIAASQRTVFMGSMLEIIFIVVAATGLVVAIRPAQMITIFSWIKPVHIILFALIGALGTYVALNWKTLQTIKVTPVLFRKGFVLLAWYAIVLIVQAFIPVVIGFQIMELPYENSTLLNLISASLLAWIGGFITIGASGGMGVREIIFCSIVPNISFDTLLLICLMQRMINILGDFAFPCLTYLSSNSAPNANNFHQPNA